jgi:glycosyltransferase involved in cell wall biosynthesis
LFKISIIIPIYKVKENYLRVCFESIINQTLEDIQIIAVDDGAPESCGLICDEYATRDPRVLAIHNVNGGVSNARNCGIACAEGKYILFVDADDWLETNICEKVYTYAESHQSEIVMFSHDQVFGTKKVPCGYDGRLEDYTGAKIIEMQLKILRYTSKHKYKSEFGTMNLCASWCKLYLTDFVHLNRLKFFEELKRGEDMVFNLYALEKAQKVSLMDCIGYHYRIHDESESQVYTPEIGEISKKTLSRINQFIHNGKKDIRFLKGYYAYSIETLYEQMYMYFFNRNNKRPWYAQINSFIKIMKKAPYRYAPYKVEIGKLNFRHGTFAIFQRAHLTRLFCCLYILNRKRKERNPLP